MKSTTKAAITISAVFAVLFVPPLFFDTHYVESFGETGMRSFCAIFVSIFLWALFHRVSESRQERRKNSRAEIARNRMRGCILMLMFGAFGVALMFTLNFILCIEGY